ncbi:MAG: phage tail family protein [Eubacteriales bacterium]|nr:phage tail family protein [Eubacteriales bacterium]
MQKITYINLMNESLVFQGAPYVLCKVSGLGMPDVDMETIRGAYQQGETVAAFRRGARHIDLTVHLMGSSRAELYALRTRALRILSPDRAVDGESRAVLIYENDSGRWQTGAIPENGLDAGSRVQNVQPNLKLSFRCESPYWYTPLESRAVIGETVSGLTLPFTLPISLGRGNYSEIVRNDGDVACPVEMWIEGRGEAPSLLNRRTGKRLTLMRPLTTGCTLHLCTDPARLRAVITDSDGVETSAFGLLSVDTPLADFTLLPGLNELVYLQGGSTAHSVIHVAWRAAFEGV